MFLIRNKTFTLGCFTLFLLGIFLSQQIALADPANTLARISHHFSSRDSVDACGLAPSSKTEELKKWVDESAINWIEQKWKAGFIYDEAAVVKLRGYLDSEDPRIRKLAARTIIEEVLGVEEPKVDLRLRALEVLKPFLKVNTESDIYGQIDVHNHTCMSDAYQTPTALVVEAYENGLSVLGITDHEVFTSEEAIKAADMLGVNLVFGAEASCKFEDHEVHMLIFGDRKKFNSLSDEGRRILKKLQNMKEEWLLRTTTMRDRLRPVFDITDEELKAASRSFIVPLTLFNAIWKKYPEKANELEPGCASGKEFFAKYIKNRPGIYEKANDSYALTIDEAIRLGYELDGKVVLSHPNELDKDKDKAIGRMKRIFKKARSVKVDGKDASSVFAGPEGHSHKASLSGIKDAVAEAVEDLNKTTYSKNPLILFAGSDSHGKYSLPDHPLGISGYPQDDSQMRVLASNLSLMTKEKVEAGKTFMPLLTQEEITSLTPVFSSVKDFWNSDWRSEHQDAVLVYAV
ncbi:PHP domain-containing protein, partial [Candidatus Auribacterota bacterium]